MNKRLLQSVLGSILLFGMAVSGGVFGADLNKAKGTVDNIKQAEPPKVEKSTETKPSPVGQPVSDYKPKGPSVKPKEPPPPKK